MSSHHFCLIISSMMWRALLTALLVHSCLLGTTHSLAHNGHKSKLSPLQSKLNRTLTKLHSNSNEFTAKADISPSFSKKELDAKIVALAGPAILNFIVVPLVGAVDTYWVGRMRNAMALAGQGAANQVFSSLFWIISFLPNIVTPQVAQAAGAKDKTAVQDRIGEALFLGLIMGAFGMILLALRTDNILSLVLPGSSNLVKTNYALPYLRLRGLTFIPALLTTIGIAGFRGTMDVFTPLKISIFSNIVNLVLDPILMFPMKMGVVGAALATCASEVVACAMYLHLMIKKELVDTKRLLNIPSFGKLKPLLINGLTVQLRAVALQIAILAVTRKTQMIDPNGVSAAAHSITIQLWQITGTILLAMSSVASILVSNERAKAMRASTEGGGTAKASLKTSLLVGKFTADRLLFWGVILGFVLGLFQLSLLPLLTVFTPLVEIQREARIPSIIGSVLQVLNGVVFIGEGIQQANQSFLSLAFATILSTVGMLTSLHLFGNTLVGIWGSYGVFNFIRLLGVLRHHYFSGPLALRTINKVETSVAKST